MKEIVQVDKLSNEQNRLTYEDGSYLDVDIIRIETREQAIQIALTMTENALKKKGAIEKLHLFRNDFSMHRNYEIEEYIDRLGGVTAVHQIYEDCPFNGYSWFDKSTEQTPTLPK